ncbi:MAG: hypothetical protein LBV17_00555 [Treponema sp.]|jgi:hypothetical protein|nr:hypothetical protein [Treponema sp.]
MKKIIFLILFSCVAFSGFSQAGGSSEIKTVYFEEDENGYVQFYTNDPENTACIITDDYPTENTNSDGFEMEVIRINGSETVLFGMLFGAEHGFSWYAVFIGSNGDFQIYKCSSWAIIMLAEGNTKLVAGEPGKTNTIKVAQKEGKYKIYLNNNKFPLYIINNIDIKGNKIGYCVHTRGDDSFPEKYVDIRYKVKE